MSGSTARNRGGCRITAGWGFGWRLRDETLDNVVHRTNLIKPSQMEDPYKSTVKFRMISAARNWQGNPCCRHTAGSQMITERLTDPQPSIALMIARIPSG